MTTARRGKRPSAEVRTRGAKRNGRFGRPLLLLAAAVLFAGQVFAQHERAELRLEVHDPTGGPVSASASLVSEADHVRLNFQTDSDGRRTVRGLPFGIYRLNISSAGFTPWTRILELRSEIPLTLSVMLNITPVQTRINVSNSRTLIDPQATRAVYSIGSQAAQEEVPVQLGRGLSDLVDAEPGWLYEANGVLHPRGSEYDVQYVVNGLPLTENRSPAFSAPMEAEDVQSMRVLTAGFPAEYGRKLGGVVEIDESQNQAPGLHLTAIGEGGSFSEENGYLSLGYARGANQFTLAGNAGSTERYLDPPVTGNFTNHGSIGAFSGVYSVDITPRNRVRFSVVHNELRYDVPNEQVQETAGQRQDAASTETSGQVDYELTISPALFLAAEASVRDEAFQLWSNDLAVPVIASQQRGFREGYARVSLAGHHGRHYWKLGADAIFNPVHEALQYRLTEPSLFDPGTAAAFNFADHRTDTEPSAFAEDEIHWRNWNANIGLRYDDYHFVVSQSALSPRLSISHYFSSAGVLVHASYDRVFQTPAIENLLLASSPDLSQVSTLVLRLPVEPSRANYYEIGAAKAFWRNLRVETNVFRRDFRNFSDDDTFFDTGISFPIADARAWIQGVEAKVEAPQWGRFSGFISYANQEGVGQGPITGGLFIGAQAIAGIPDNSRFWVSQDQRNTAHARLRFQAAKRLWLAMDSAYGSGLPVELDTGDTDYAFLLAQYGSGVLSQVDFARGRVRPSYSLGASAGVEFYRKENKSVEVEVEGSNLTDHLNVINFASLFSGTAIAVPRSVDLAIRFGF